MSVAEFDADLVVNGAGCILGRVASQVAERALDGETVAVVNTERLVITGDEADVVQKYRKRTELGSDRGPNYPKRPDGITKRSIRGMLPHTTNRGRHALESVRTYVGNPYDEDGQQLEGTTLDRLSNTRFVQLGDVSEQIGANVTW